MMSERTIILVMMLLLPGPFFGAQVVDAQEPITQEPPRPAAKAYPPIGGANDEESNPPVDQLQPDNRPLTGFQQPTLGVNAERHSYWIPGVSYINSVQSNAFTQGGGSAWTSTSYLGGNISLLQNWS